MRSVFYPKLAFQNINKNQKFYIPYLITCVFTVAMYYNLRFLTSNKGLSQIPHFDDLRMILALGCSVVAIFSAIFLFYTNSFLIKHRKKEFGLYNILGMSKFNIAHSLVWETIYTALSTIIIGLFFGVVLSKLLLLLLCRFLNFSVPLGFEIQTSSILITATLFLAIFIVTLLYNLLSIRIAKPVELLHGSNFGEKEPKAKWILSVIGILCLGTAYTIAIAVESPLSAFGLFFVAVILVIIGTYLLFMTGSIAILKILRNKKGYYYKTKHFTSVSGMIYRMKQNAAGLASICILSTMVLVMVSGTLCLYTGAENSLINRYPNDISLSIPLNGSSKNTEETVTDSVHQIAKKQGRTLSDEKYYKYLYFATVMEDNNFTLYKQGYANTLKSCEVSVITAEEYNRLTGEDISLNDNELLAQTLKKPYKWDTMTFENKQYNVKWIKNYPFPEEFTVYITNVLCLVVKDSAALNDIYNLQKETYGDNSSDIVWKYCFNVNGTDEEIVSFFNAIESATKDEIHTQITDDNGNSVDKVTYKTYGDCRQVQAADFYTTYGGLLFIGIFLGLLFLGATALIIYYKQISEGYDDKDRYEIMQKVGMSREEVKHSINAQVLTVFFLPLITAIIHLAFSFKIISKLLLMFGITKKLLFLACILATVAFFGIIYSLIYYFTAKVYYRIVRS